MVMKNKDWSINFTRPAAARALTEAGFTPLLSQVLALRGVDSADQAKTCCTAAGRPCTIPC